MGRSPLGPGRRWRAEARLACPARSVAVRSSAFMAMIAPAAGPQLSVRKTGKPQYR